MSTFCLFAGHRTVLRTPMRCTTSKPALLQLQTRTTLPVHRPTAVVPHNRRTTVSVCAVTSVGSGKDSIEVEEVRMPGSVMHLKIQIPAPLSQQFYDHVIATLRKEVQMPGFRTSTKPSKKGKKSKGAALTPSAKTLPVAMIVNAAGGPKAVNASAVEEALMTTVPLALEQYKDVVVTDSERILTPVETLIDTYQPGQAMEYEMEVELAPTVQWTGSYQGLEVEVEEAASAAMIAQEVEDRILTDRKDAAQVRVVTGRGLQKGDVVIMDVCIRLREEEGSEGESAVLTERSKMRLDTDDADKEFLPGVSKELENLVVGEKREFTLTLPSDFEPAQFRSQQVDVSVYAHELFEYNLPPLDNQWANSRYPGCTVEKMREMLHKRFAKQAEEETQRRVKEALTKALGAIAECEIPTSLIRSFGETEYQARLLEACQKGMLSFEQMEGLATEEALDHFVSNKRDELTVNVKELAAIEQVFKEQNLVVPQNQIDREYAAAAVEFRQQGQEYDEEKLMEQVVETLKAEAVLTWLEDHAHVRVLPYGSLGTAT